MELPHDLVAKAGQLCGYSKVERYTARADFLFAGIDLRGKHVFDVGCGRGTWALWAGLNGATRVVGIEPGISGSTSGSFAKFKQAIPALGLMSVVAAQAIDTLKLTTTPFDVIVLLQRLSTIFPKNTRERWSGPSRACITVTSSATSPD